MLRNVRLDCFLPLRYQIQLVKHIRRGYNGLDDEVYGQKLRWTIPAALMYCITIYTTIGMELMGIMEVNSNSCKVSFFIAYFRRGLLFS